MNSLWTSKIYYMFGFLFLCYGLMIITTAATTVLLVYFMLCAEDYRWPWRAFAGAGMTGFYVFVNALIFWITRVSFGGFTGTVLYVGYSALIGLLVFIMTGQSLPPPMRLAVWQLSFVNLPFISQARLVFWQAGCSSTRYMALSRLTSDLSNLIPDHKF